jgi:hypothetical protein
MNVKIHARRRVLAVLALSLSSLVSAGASIAGVKVFATGGSIDATNPDSICQGYQSIWVA